ncbi:MAG: ATP-binding protein, partial [Armatimonadota bacterium]
DLNNFLSTILFRIEIMLLDLDQTQRMDPQTLVDGLQQIALAARDGGEALERLSSLASANPYEPVEKVDLNDVLHTAAELSQGRVEGPARYELSFDLEELPRIDGSPAGLRTVFTNLIINAYHALAEREGARQIRVRSYREGEYVVAQIIDEGIGMTDEVMARLSEPFFTTKGEGGTGLGLTVAHKVVAQHNGTIEFESVPGAGTTVTVTLPISQSRVRHSAACSMPIVMVVDDQHGMLVVTREVLQSHGFGVLTAASGEEALPLFRQALSERETDMPIVLITDLRMPGMTGTDLAREVKALAPDTCVIILSAFLEEADPEGLEFADLALEKPFDLRELCQIVSEMIASRSSAH